MAPRLQRVAQQHGCHGKKAEGCQGVHLAVSSRQRADRQPFIHLLDPVVTPGSR